MRAIWTGSVTFGLVNIPVRLYNATTERDVRFHQFERGTGRRIRYPRVAEDDAGGFDPSVSERIRLPEPPPPPAANAGQRPPAPPDTPEAEKAGERLAPRREVEYEDVVRGYEVDRGRFVMLEPEEIAALEPERSRTIEIEEFVDLSDIDPVYFDKSYYMGPQRGAGAEKPYALLLQAMEGANRVGIARFVLRTKEYMAAIRPMSGILVLETLFFADEVREAKDVAGIPVEVNVSDRELTMAGQLIEFLGASWDPGRYRDSYRERVLDLIASRAAGGEVVAEAEPAVVESRVPDLMAALRASVEALKEDRAVKRGTRRRSG